MTNRSEQLERREREERVRDEAARIIAQRAAWRGRVIVAAGISAIVIAPIATAFILGGCGGQSTGSQNVATQATTAPPEQPTVAIAALSGGSTVGAETGVASGRPEALPPDIVVSVPDTLVSPGEPIEFSVQGTSDVTELALADGINDPQPFVRDSTGTWRVSYRVPLRPKHERFGLSVTAKNDANRWRRVWVFLRVKNVEAEQSRIDESREPEPGSEGRK